MKNIYSNICKPNLVNLRKAKKNLDNNNVIGIPTKSDDKRGKATLVNLLGYEETINFASNLKNQISKKIKKYGIKANDLLDSVGFILERKF